MAPGGDCAWCSPGPVLFLLSQEKPASKVPRDGSPHTGPRSPPSQDALCQHHQPQGCGSLEARRVLVFSEQVLTSLPAFSHLTSCTFLGDRAVLLARRERAAFLEDVREHSRDPISSHIPRSHHRRVDVLASRSGRSIHLQLCQLCADLPTFSQRKSHSYECDFWNCVLSSLPPGCGTTSSSKSLLQ